MSELLEMSRGLLEIGMKINLELKNSDKKNEDQQRYFSSKIEDITQNGIVVNMPMKGGSTFYVGTDEKINIYFPKKGSFYCLECIVKDKRYYPIPVLTVLPLKPPHKKQKRSYFRLQVTLKVCIKLAEDGDWLKGLTKDISGGGLRFSNSREIKNGSIVELKIPEVLGETVIKAVVVRNERTFVAGEKKYEIAVKFVELNEKQRDIIIKYIFSKQRELREKGISN